MDIENRTTKRLSVSIGMSNIEEPTIVVKINRHSTAINLPDEPVVVIEEAKENTWCPRCEAWFDETHECFKKTGE